MWQNSMLLYIFIYEDNSTYLDQAVQDQFKLLSFPASDKPIFTYNQIRLHYL